jgi:hypothetical protein
MPILGKFKKHPLWRMGSILTLSSIDSGSIKAGGFSCTIPRTLTKQVLRTSSIGRPKRTNSVRVCSRGQIPSHSRPTYFDFCPCFRSDRPIYPPHLGQVWVFPDTHGQVRPTWVTRARSGPPVILLVFLFFFFAQRHAGRPSPLPGATNPKSHRPTCCSPASHRPVTK